MKTIKKGMKFRSKEWPENGFIQVDQKHGPGFNCSGWPNGKNGCFFSDFFHKFELDKMIIL